MNPKHTLLAICCADLLLLAACGGGSGSGGGMVRSDPPPALPPSPPPANAENVCPAPITADCVVDDRWKTESGSTIGSLYLFGGRQSDHSLIKRGGNYLSLEAGTYGFADTSVEEGLLLVERGATLNSAITVHAGGTLSVTGESRGDIVNRGHMALAGTVTGQVTNHGYFAPGAAVYDSNVVDTVVGDFRQTATGTLQVALPPSGWDYSGTLRVTGRADIDGTLELYQLWDWDIGYYPLPATPSAIAVLHADGGIFGQFARWTSPGLFVEGNVRYDSHDVWFDLTRISLQSAMAAKAAGDPMTLASAANIDAALASADVFATAPAASLAPAQRRFLASAAVLLSARDAARATRSLDSLSGQAHGLAQDVLHEQTAATVAQLDARLDRLPRGGLPGGAWSAPLAHHGRLGGSYSVDGHAGGFDLWMGPQWLIGGSVATTRTQMQFERMGGHGHGDSPMASVHAHVRGAGWHATGVVGASRTALQLQRPIDFGAAGTHLAHSRRQVAQAFVHAEFGRRVVLGNGQLTPFVAVDHTSLHSDGFVEQGDTGFELAAQAAHSAQLSAAAGARYARDWRLDGGGWLQLDLDARYQLPLSGEGDALRAAFVGAPDAMFDLPAWSRSGHSAALSLGLTGGMGDRWAWSLDYARRFGGDPVPGGWFVGLRRDF